MKNTWKIIKQAMNVTKNKSDINTINFNDEIVEDPSDIVNIFNNYFSSIGENLAVNIPPSNKHFVDFLGQPNQKSIFFVPTHRCEVLDMVSKLKTKKSSGHDEINNFILKGIISSVVDPLVHHY